MFLEFPPEDRWIDRWTENIMPNGSIKIQSMVKVLYLFSELYFQIKCLLIKLDNQMKIINGVMDLYFLFF